VTPLSGILDANGAIGLSKGQVFDLLRSVYAPLYVPPSVREEVVDQGQGLAGAQELAQALGHWIAEMAPSHQALQEFAGVRSLADREVLALARETGANHILTGDERLLRRAQGHGFTCIRTTEVVVVLKQRGLIASVKPVLDRMRAQGFFVDDLLYQAALRAAQE
jgi:predicted nucleic acid-binding protein